MIKMIWNEKGAESVRKMYFTAEERGDFAESRRANCSVSDYLKKNDHAFDVITCIKIS